MSAEIHELTPDEAAKAFDRICRRELDITAKVFLARWDRGYYSGIDVDDLDGLPDVVAALPLVRETATS